MSDGLVIGIAQALDDHEIGVVGEPEAGGDGGIDRRREAKDITAWSRALGGDRLEERGEGAQALPVDGGLDDGGPASFESSPFVPTDVLRERRRALEEVRPWRRLELGRRGRLAK